MKGETRVCAVCGEEKPIKEFGSGILIPKTTCIFCKNSVYYEDKTIMNIKKVRGGNMTVIKMCPKCRKQSAEYTFNAHGVLAFTRCNYCGYSARQYAEDLRETK